MDSLKEIKTWLQQQSLSVSVHDAKGFSVLFDGPQVADKLKAAETVAKEAGKSLRRVALSQLASKYIGETEKSLQQIFDQARENNWILFFDEADALFGKRTNVKDSHDRYATVEANYLLQQVNSYPGLVIFAAHQKANIDTAYLRHFRTVLHFQ